MSERAAIHADWLVPDFDAIGLGALMTTRQGGISLAPFDTLNMKPGIGDDPQSVLHNQRVVAAAIGAVPVYLDQVHGAAVVRLSGVDELPQAPLHTADASVTTERGMACTVQVADCLPVLFAATRERTAIAVAAAHAGWRGLARGVLEATLRELCDAAECEADQVQCWLGACIGPREFEVGADVLDAFGVSPQTGGSARFVAKSPGKWWAELPSLARDRLAAAGVGRVSGGAWCTVADSSRFFSYRRDGVTGRMVAAIWLDAGRV